MKSKTLLTLLVLAIIAIAAFFLFRGDKSEVLSTVNEVVEIEERESNIEEVTEGSVVEMAVEKKEEVVVPRVNSESTNTTPDKQVKVEVEKESEPEKKEEVPTEVTASNTSIMAFNVESKLVDCEGVMPMKCMVVNGQYFYDQIKGFDFEEGYTYTLKVERTELPLELVPADAGIYEYSLVEVVEKEEA